MSDQPPWPYGQQPQDPRGQQPGWPPQQPYQGQPPYPPQGQPPYGQQYPPPGPPQRGPRRRQSWLARHKVLAVLGGATAVIVIAVAASAAHHAPPAAAAGNVAATTPAASTPAATAAATARAAAAPEQSPSKRTVPLITYVVTGTATGAQVTYGPEGTDLTGHVPMRITKHLGTAMYYAIQAQLQGGGHVTVKIEINGKVISSGTADGGYNIAMAEISQDPVTGQWEDTQG